MMDAQRGSASALIADISRHPCPLPNTREQRHMTAHPPRVLVENILSNYAYVAVMGIVTLVATPIYVKTLGASQWGLVALCMTAQGLLLLLDAGMGQVLPREVARAARDGRAMQAYLAALKLYGTVAVATMALGQALASLIASHLIPSNVALQSDLMIVLRLVLVQFLFQFPNNAAIGYWVGVEQQRTANLRQAGFAVCKHGLALTLVTQWQPTALAYMLPFALVGALEFLANWRRLVTAVADAPATGQSPSVRRLIASAGGFSTAVIAGMLTWQIDRLYLANTVSTELFGIYTVAANLAMTLMHLQGPVQRAFLPRIVAAERPPMRMVWQMLGLIAVVGLLPCVVLALVAEPLLRLWLHDAHIAQAGAPVFQLIAIAIGLNGLYGAVYSLFIRDNLFGRLIALNLFILAGQMVLLTLLSDRLSIAVGGASWLFGSCVQVAFGVFTVITLHRQLRVD